MKAAVPTDIQINERDIYLDDWKCRSTFDALITEPLKLMAALNKKYNLTAPLINSND